MAGIVESGGRVPVDCPLTGTIPNWALFMNEAVGIWTICLNCRTLGSLAVALRLSERATLMVIEIERGGPSGVMPSMREGSVPSQVSFQLRPSQYWKTTATISGASTFVKPSPGSEGGRLVLEES